MYGKGTASIQFLKLCLMVQKIQYLCKVYWSSKNWEFLS